MICCTGFAFMVTKLPEDDAGCACGGGTSAKTFAGWIENETPEE